MKNESIYFTYLDALRAIAFLGVFYAHSGTIFTGTNPWVNFPLNIWGKFTVYGSYGVNFFFVLSGFLITFLLLREREKTGSINIRHFYRKRVLRIWPVYFVTLFFAAWVLPSLISPETYAVYTMTNPHMTSAEFWYSFFFSANFYQGLSLGMAPLSIGILWSVCIEEQFYLIWPWLVKWFNPRRLLLATTAIITLSLAYKFIWADDRMANYYLPWSLAMDLGFGALIGIGHYLKKTREMLLLAGIIFGAVLIYAGLVILAHLLPQIHLIHMILSHEVLSDLLRLIKTIVLDIIFGVIIIFFINRKSNTTVGNKNETRQGITANFAISKNNTPSIPGHDGSLIPLDVILAHPIQKNSWADHTLSYLLKVIHISRRNLKNTLIHLGKISYGLYAYHAIALMLMVQISFTLGLLNRAPDGTPSLIQFILVIGGGCILTIIFAELSYRFIERRFLALKEIKSK